MTERPLPEITDENSVYWNSLLARSFRLQQCDQCAHVRYPLSEICPVCLSSDYRWAAMSGRGHVFSTVVFHQVYHPAFADKVPYNVSLVELEEGPIIVTNVIDVDPREVGVGDEVDLVYTELTAEIVLPQFRLAASRTSA
jgi:uncharacterized OB-fold protein